MILAGEAATVNGRLDQVISFCEDGCFASPGACPREDYLFVQIAHVHTTSFFISKHTHTYTNAAPKSVYGKSKTTALPAGGVTAEFVT